MIEIESIVDLLLVEDNPSDVELTLHALRKYNITNTVKVVRDGAEAIEFLFGPESSRLPKLVLLDLKLPKLDGLEVLQRIRDDPRTRNLPVVILSTSREERDVVESYRLYANSYIVKPVDFEQFTETVRVLGMYWLLLNQPPILPATEGPYGHDPDR